MDPLANYVGPLVYDGYVGKFRAADPLSLDPMDLEAVTVWEEEHGARWDPTVRRSRPPRHPRRARRVSQPGNTCAVAYVRVRHRYAETTDGLLRVCLDCAQGPPLAQLAAWEAAGELIAVRRQGHRHDFIERLRARFPELPWDSSMVRDGRQRREIGPAGRSQVWSPRQVSPWRIWHAIAYI